MATPPTGTVTFLFTDIQGSTGLWERHAGAMRPALARHDALLRQGIEGGGGFVFKTVGDGVCAAFPTAPEALAAALAAQLALAGEPWGLPEPLLVRMGLHTGAAEERDGDYFGPPLNRVARLMAVGAGGQVLLSDVTQGLVRDVLPPDTSLRDLGGHRLRDLGRPERVFQLRHPSLPDDFPPLRSLDNPDFPNNLPQQPTSFVGREKEFAEVRALLDRTRLLTLVAAGGSGKTRLSLQVAADLLTGDGDGVWFVELAGLSDPALVPQAVAGVLGVQEAAGKSVRQALVEWLRPRRLLLILDNCEHLLAACASLAADLLRHCPGVSILASSREPLNVPGEQTYRVPLLSLPDPRRVQTPQSLSRYEAVRLFLDRARSVQPSFAVTDANAPAVAEVCFHLDGIPLAIELAAARVRSLPVEQISTRLDQRFRLLTGGSRTLLPRQQTLQALMDWSYDLLTDQEKTLLRRLSVFAGGWTLAAAEGVCSGDGIAGGRIEDWEVLDLLTALTDKSLVVYEDGAGGAGRSRLLETVRQYAGERLAEAGEAEAAQGRAAAWFLALAEEAEPHLRGSEQASWLTRLEADHDNLRASLSWYERQPERAQNGADSGLRLAGALWRFWYVRGHLSEGRQWLDGALARTKRGTAEPPGASGGSFVGREAAAAQGKALNGAGVLAQTQGDYAAARALQEESLSIRRQLGDQRGIAAALNSLGIVARDQSDYAGARVLLEESLSLMRQSGDQNGISNALNSLGNVARDRGDYAGARSLYEESLSLMRRLGDLQGIAAALGNLGNVVREQGDYAGARSLYEESLSIRRQLGDQQGIANALNNLGLVAYEQGDYAGARSLYEESLSLMRRLGDLRGVASAFINLGLVAHEQGDYAGARLLLDESLSLMRQSGNRVGIAEVLEGMVGVALGQGQPVRAARLGAASAALRERLGSPLPPFEQEDFDTMMASAAAALGGAAFAAAEAAGRAMTEDQAIEYALSLEPS